MVERPLQILQVSTADIKGGAEKVAWNLFTAYRARGHSSWLAVGQKTTNDPDVMALPNPEARGKWYELIRRFTLHFQHANGCDHVETPLTGLPGALAEPKRRLERFFGMEDFNFPGTSQLLTLTRSAVDILHAHNLHGGYFDLRMLPWLSKQVPMLLTLHDAWLLSGHCAHSFACERWKNGCGQCPDLNIYPEVLRDATAYNWQTKRKIFLNSRLYVASPSRWLMNKVEASILAPAVIEARVVPNGVDMKTFRPTDKREARAVLGVRSDARVLLTMGVSPSKSRWKDYQTLREASSRLAERLKNQDLLLIVVGEDAPPDRIDGVEIKFVPFQRDPQTIARYHQAADIYVHPALADTFPNAVLEAQACGIPVIATAVGGIPEQVENGKGGFLVPSSDPAVLADRITQLLSQGQLRDSMGRFAARYARRNFDLDSQVKAYLAWYHELALTKATSSAIYR